PEGRQPGECEGLPAAERDGAESEGVHRGGLRLAARDDAGSGMDLPARCGGRQHPQPEPRLPQAGTRDRRPGSLSRSNRDLRRHARATGLAGALIHLYTIPQSQLELRCVMVARNPERPSFARNPEVRAITEALSVPFDPKDVKFKPQMVKNNRALAMAYIDARLIQDRLDDVLGAEHWQDEYQLLADGAVVCRLRLKLGGRWITKMDVGSPSEQPDVGDRLKAAFSDALKRAAVKFGIGRYLYRLPAQWVDYDPAKKQIAQRPELPAFALPTSK